MINAHQLKAGNQVGFKMIFKRGVSHSSGTVKSVEGDTVEIDGLKLNIKNLLPIILTSDTLVKIGCVQLTSKNWRTADFIEFEFDGLLVRFGNDSAPIFYLHLFQNAISQLKEEVSV